MCNDLRIHADGSTIYTPCGHVFRAGDTQSSDMTWVGDLGVGWKDIAFNPSSAVAYALRDNGAALQEIDTEQLTLQASHLSLRRQRGSSRDPTTSCWCTGCLGRIPDGDRGHRLFFALRVLTDDQRPRPTLLPRPR